jgi:hypothetical protein
MSILAGLGGRIVLMEFNASLATAFGESAPGISFLEFNILLAGRRGRRFIMEFTERLATAMGKGAPGNSPLEFTRGLAGRRGRRWFMEFTRIMATAFRIFIALSRCPQPAVCRAPRR